MPIRALGEEPQAKATGSGYYASLVLPVTTYSGYLANRAPDQMEISAKGTLLTITYN